MAHWKIQVKAWIKKNKLRELTVNQICEDCLGENRSRLTKSDRGEIAAFLFLLGWRRSTITINKNTVNKKSVSGYILRKPLLDKHR